MDHFPLTDAIVYVCIEISNWKIYKGTFQPSKVFSVIVWNIMRGVKGGSCLLITVNFEAFFPFTVIFLAFTVNHCKNMMILMTYIDHEFGHMS